MPVRERSGDSEAVLWSERDHLTWNTGETLNSRLLSILGELHIDLGLDVYGSDLATDEPS